MLQRVLWFFVSVGRCQSCRAELPFWCSVWKLAEQSPCSLWRLLFCDACVESESDVYISCSRKYRMCRGKCCPPVPFVEKWWRMFLLSRVADLAPSRRDSCGNHWRSVAWISGIQSKMDRSIPLTPEEAAVRRSWVWCWICSPIPIKPLRGDVCLWVKPVSSSRSRGEQCRETEAPPTRTS